MIVELLPYLTGLVIGFLAGYVTCALLSANGDE